MRQFCVVALLAVWAGMAWAAGVSGGLAAYRAGDYAGALRLWRAAGAGGDAAAQKGLGDLYVAGKGVAPDAEEAFPWYRRAAGTGLPPAQSAPRGASFIRSGAQQGLL